MNRKPKHIKIYHPGMISLIILPVLLVIYIYHDAIVTKYFLTEVVWRTRSIEATSHMYGSEFYRNGNDTSYRQYKTVLVDGQEVKANAAMQQASVLIKQMIAKKDTVNGVRVKFGSKATYKNMVDVINLCFLNEQPNFDYYCVDDEVMAYYKVAQNSDHDIWAVCGFNGGSEPEIRKIPVLEGIKYINQNLNDFGLNNASILIACVAWLILFFGMAFKPVTSLFS
ncbi:hypothetical protein LJ707_01250 [Mucilaginibacter sp. UR6-1]|uniref:hypothetical protein n=1 Tax=Mucilaginibacter sp. UR6-1 TaxID=1435643 RepID=UPI001E59E875|nr:hypothetical protein [Mucilaginibacter sp. UR6-1]MCC8407537.1 hypothetical protein [Mucilaginibacter sp. UR6-1]